MGLLRERKELGEITRIGPELTFVTLGDPRFVDVLRRLAIEDEKHCRVLNVVTATGFVISDVFSIAWWHTSGVFVSCVNDAGRMSDSEYSALPNKEDRAEGMFTMAVFRSAGGLSSGEVK